MLPTQDRLPILQLAGQTGTVLERLHADPQAKPLPISRGEMLERGWDAVDVVFVTGDAYVDHPSFAAAILGTDFLSFGIGNPPSATWNTPFVVLRSLFGLCRTPCWIR